jgi:carboxyl-terminal processing protease
VSKVEKFERILITILVAISFFYGGYYMGKRGYTFEVRKNPPEIKIQNISPSSSNVDFSLFWQVWDEVTEQYLERPVDAQKMVYGAITGMVEALGDPYTTFLPPEVNESVNDSINGNYQGIGAELGFDDNGQLIVVAPLDGSPAKDVGLRSSDKIVEIDKASTAGITLTEAVSKIRGDAGTVVTLTIKRGEEDAFELPIKRGIVNVDSVTWEDKGDGTLYIRVSRFGDDTNKEWSKAVAEANTKMKELDAIVLDVRGNPGGYLQSAHFLGDEFIKKGPILWNESAVGEQQAYNAERPGVFENIPVIYVLIDEGSASASEILAAALKEQVGAKLIGAKSFGKGTIQSAKDFDDGSGVHVTVAKWLTPNKNWVHKNGLEPDMPVELDIEKFNDGTDTQLDKALELAKEI